MRADVAVRAPDAALLVLAPDAAPGVAPGVGQGMVPVPPPPAPCPEPDEDDGELLGRFGSAGGGSVGEGMGAGDGDVETGAVTGMASASFRLAARKRSESGAYPAGRMLEPWPRLGFTAKRMNGASVAPTLAVMCLGTVMYDGIGIGYALESLWLMPA